MVSPMPSFNPSSMDTLCSDALDTIVPSSSTGSNTATGFINPVLDTSQSTFLNVVEAVSSFHLNARESLGNLAVLPSDSLYDMSLYVITNPSDGMS